jgi:ABC-type Na+ efflux pump permease subunit
MRVIDLALKDLLQVVRDRKSIIFLVLMPIAFTLFFGFILSGSISDPRLPVGWINADGESDLSRNLSRMLEQSMVIRLVPFDLSAASSASGQVRDEKLAAAVSVPPGFGAQAMAGGAGEAFPIAVVVLPGSQAGRTASAAIQAAVNHLLSAVIISQISVEAFEAQQLFTSPEARQAFADQALAQANQAWAQPSFTIREDAAVETSGAA